MTRKTRGLAVLVLVFVFVMSISSVALALGVCTTHESENLFTSYCLDCWHEYLGQPSEAIPMGQELTSFVSRFCTRWNYKSTGSTPLSKVSFPKCSAININGVRVESEKARDAVEVGAEDLLALIEAKRVSGQLAGLSMKNFKLIEGRLYCNGVLMEDGGDYSYRGQQFKFQPDDASDLINEQFSITDSSGLSFELIVNDGNDLLLPRVGVDDGMELSPVIEAGSGSLEQPQSGVGDTPR